MTSTDDLIIWPDATWCFRYELGEYSHKSDDYYTIPFASVEYYRFLKALAPWELNE